MSHRPLISPDKNISELTFKGVALGFLLSAVLAGANTYLGLFAGMTVSASIPAAVMAMAIFKAFRKSTILEHNAVQTAASAGESLAAGAIFTFPALIMMGYWSRFNYFETLLISLCGGLLGVMFTIPLRHALIVKQQLQFPEGVATSEVLKASENSDSGIKYLVVAALAGALFKLLAGGLKLWADILDLATVVQEKTIAYFGINLSPALVAVGYIVGLRIAVLVFAGGVISWWIALPVLAAMEPLSSETNAVAMSYGIWSKKIRYLGVGAMITGGIWALISIRHALKDALKQAIQSIKTAKESRSQTLRTEKDLPGKWTAGFIVLLFGLLLLLYIREINLITVSVIMGLIMLVAGFLFSAVAGYMAGLVGSSNNPISGVTIATILFASLMLLLIMGTGNPNGPAAAILIGAVVCCAAAIAGDNMQDLKAGYILGSTPWKQQIMQMVGVVAAALVMAPVLELLKTGYGFGPKTEELPNALAAPQATLMQSVAQGVFGGNLPWGLISIGAGIGILVILADEFQKRREAAFRIPVLAVAVGLYLPFELDSAIMLGGVVWWLLHRKNPNRGGKAGLLFASGLITGEALVGILLAIPVAVLGSADALAIFKGVPPVLPGVAALLAIILGLFWAVTKAPENSSKE